MKLNQTARICCLVLSLLMTGFSVLAQKPEREEDSLSNEALLIENVKRGDLQKILALLTAGTSPDASDDEGMTALQCAIKVNRRDIAELLLNKGADVNKEAGDYQTTALDVAAAAGRAHLIRLLIERKANVNHKDRHGHSVLWGAAAGAMMKSAPPWMVKAILGEDDSTEELLAAMGSEHYVVAELLLKDGADVNAAGEDCSLTPLMLAALGGDVELTKILLQHKAKVGDALRFAEISGADLLKEIDDFDTSEEKQAVINWIQFSAPGRKEVAKLLRAASAP